MAAATIALLANLAFGPSPIWRQRHLDAPAVSRHKNIFGVLHICAEAKRRPKLAIGRRRPWMHESGIYVKFTGEDARLFGC